MIKKLFLILFLFIGQAAYFAQTIEAWAETNSSEYYVGDYIHYTLKLRYSKNITVHVPSIIDTIKELDFIREDTPQGSQVDDDIVEYRKFVFSKYDSAEVTIPGYKIEYNVEESDEIKSVNVNPVQILVKTIEVNSSSDIQDVKAPIKIQLPWWLITLIVLGVALIGALVYYLIRRYKNRKHTGVTTRKIIIEPPYKIALKALDELEYKKLWQQGLVKEYHTEVTGIIRKYFEERFKFKALEMTSGEVVENLNKHSEASSLISFTTDFFSNADLVKFAKFKPIPSVNEEMLKQAYEIVNTTKIEEEAKIETVEVEDVH